MRTLDVIVYFLLVGPFMVCLWWVSLIASIHAYRYVRDVWRGIL